MKTGIILTGGRLDLAFAGLVLEKADASFVIAADAGLEICDRLNIVPTAAVGDFDTLGSSVIDGLKDRPDIITDVHEPEKDETDTQLAVDLALRYGCDELIILGATGGRLDHELSNIHLLKYCLDHGVRAFITDPNNIVSLIDSKKIFYKDKEFGKYISFIPLTENVRGINLTGFKYTLDHKNITIGNDPGLLISNEIAQDTAIAELEDGILICIESKD